MSEQLEKERADRLSEWSNHLMAEKSEWARLAIDMQFSRNRWRTACIASVLAIVVVIVGRLA